MTAEVHIEFRRCPECRQVENVTTGDVLRNGNHPRDKCTLPQEAWVTFRAPVDWQPLGLKN